MGLPAATLASMYLLSVTCHNASLVASSLLLILPATCLLPPTLPATLLARLLASTISLLPVTYFVAYLFRCQKPLASLLLSLPTCPNAICHKSHCQLLVSLIASSWLPATDYSCCQPLASHDAHHPVMESVSQDHCNALTPDSARPIWNSKPCLASSNLLVDKLLFQGGELSPPG